MPSKEHMIANHDKIIPCATGVRVQSFQRGWLRMVILDVMMLVVIPPMLII